MIKIESVLIDPESSAVRGPEQPAPSSPSGLASSTERTQSAPSHERGTVSIGTSVIIKGELTGSEDLTIDGQVEGTIELRQNVLTIGPNARIKAQVAAKAIVVKGQVTGNLTASEHVDIRDHGSVDGDLVAPRVAIADGAHFRGSIDMQRQGTKSMGESKGVETRHSGGAPTPAAAMPAR